MDTLAKVRELLGRMDLTGPLEERRKLMDSFIRPLPDGTRVEATGAGQPRGEWVTAAGATDEAVLLYTHGGGYYMGSAEGQRYLVTALSAAIGVRVLNLDYRLAPEHPFPAAVDDAVAAYRWLLDLGLPPERIALAGDSAGGGLVLATLLALKDAGVPQPAATVAISPLTDLAATGESLRTRADVEVVLAPGAVTEAATWYLAGQDPTHPHASPLYGEFSGLCPLLIQVGDAEMLLDDSRRLAERASAAGVDVDLEVWPDMPHVWHAFAGFLPEADTAIARIGQWLRPRLALA